MGFLVVKKTTIGGKTEAINYVCETEAEARRKYHSTLVGAYDKGDTLEHALCMLVNDLGGQILKESYFKPTEPTVDETSEG